MTGSPFLDPVAAAEWVARLREGQPHAEVERLGRWTWAVRVVHGIIVWGPDGGPFVVRGSRARADRVARRRLAEYRETEARTDRWTVR